jgi:hypothetical protein
MYAVILSLVLPSSLFEDRQSDVLLERLLLPNKLQFDNFAHNSSSEDIFQDAIS